MLKEAIALALPSFANFCQAFCMGEAEAKDKRQKTTKNF
jgi:hypothetical protein